MTASYSTLNRTQKLAAFLILLGPESAGELLRHFSPGQLEEVAREMVAIPYVDPSLRDSILEEFSAVVFQGIQAAIGGVDVTHSSLEAAKGDYMAVKLMNRVAPPSMADLDTGVSEMDGRQIYNLLREEQLQTIAFILSFMESGKAADVVRLMPAEQREEVIERLGTMEPTSRDWIKKVSFNLQRHFDRRSQQGIHKSGGVDACANILNSLDKESTKALLTAMDVRNADLGKAIRKKVFGFDDLARLIPGDLQRVLKAVEISDLAKALKGARPETVAAFYKVMSKRQAAGVMEEVEMLPPQRAKDIDVAQEKVVSEARKLDENNDISIDGGE
jgi:flagellar motor switch protein FliG